MDTLGSLESGEKYRLTIPGLDYPIELPFVVLTEERRTVRIASLNLVGQVRYNRDLGGLLAARIRESIPDMEGVGILSVVEKGLQLAQVVAQNLGIDAIAVAYNRIKPHMEADRRPMIQAGVDSITSGGKFLALYERDLNLLARADRGLIIIDDVVSTGGTLFGLVTLVEEMTRYKKLDRQPDILGIFCVAQEGDDDPLLPAPLHSLTKLPSPEITIDG